LCEQKANTKLEQTKQSLDKEYSSIKTEIVQKRQEFTQLQVKSKEADKAAVAFEV
jgi:hypothetical protein